MANIETTTLATEFKFGNSVSNYMAIEVNGVPRLNGTALNYRDEYPSGPWTEAAGAAAPDLVNYTIGGVGVVRYSFDGGTTEERLSNNFEIPHDYAVGQPIEVHVHWRPATTGTGNVEWFFDWSWSKKDLAPIAQTALSVVSNIPTNQQYFMKLDTFGNLPGTNTYELGQLLTFNIRRTPNGANDTYTGDVILEQVALHVPLDTLGSRSMYTK